MRLAGCEYGHFDVHKLLLWRTSNYYSYASYLQPTTSAHLDPKSAKTSATEDTFRDTFHDFRELLGTASHSNQRQVNNLHTYHV